MKRATTKVITPPSHDEEVDRLRAEIDALPISRAEDIKGSDHLNVLLIGGPGGGKTSQYWTIPGRKFVYVFDPNAEATLKGCPNLDYVRFSPDILDLNVKPLSASKTADRIIKADEPITYPLWEEDFDKRMQANFFEQYDAIGFDSFTTFSDIVMDRVLWLNGRLGKQPEQADWSAQMITVQNVVRTLAHRGKMLVCTAHDEIRQDELTKRIYSQPLMTGRLRVRIPMLFSDIFRCFADGGKFLFQTQSDRMHQYIRTSVQGLAFEEDVTITDWKNATKSGLGKILKEAGKL